jgi:hypothetical protein
MKVLFKLVSSGGKLRIKVSIKADLKNAASEQQIEQMKTALRELGCNCSDTPLLTKQ